MIRLTNTGVNAVVQMRNLAHSDHGVSIFEGQSVTAAMSYLQDGTVIDVEATQVIQTISNPKPVGRLRILWRRGRRAIVGVVQRIRRALATPRREVKPNAKTLTERYFYSGRHHTTANFAGRYRSTCELNTALNSARSARDPGDAKEGELPVDPDVAFITWIERYIQRMRDEGLVTHHPGRHFICS